MSLRLYLARRGFPINASDNTSADGQRDAFGKLDRLWVIKAFSASNEFDDVALRAHGSDM
jgi:hypothetical protein